VLHVTLICDLVHAALDQDAPACTERRVEVVDFEADPPIGIQGQQRVWRSAEDDGLSRYGEVHRQHHDPVCGHKPDPADAAQ
jgi:hypothetical protein